MRHNYGILITHKKGGKKMPERCNFCEDQDFACQEPTVPLIQGRWKVSLPDGQRVNLNPEKMCNCAKRVAILAGETILTGASS